MVQLVFLDSTPTSSPSISLRTKPTDSVASLRAQVRDAIPDQPSLDTIRFVRGGRFLKDDESVADVLGSHLRDDDNDNESHTIHLIIHPPRQPSQPPSQGRHATGIATSPSPPATTTAAAIPAAYPFSSSPPPSPPPSASSGPHPGAPYPMAPDPHTPLAYALSDARSLYAYLSRSALCTLLSVPALAWHELEPKPVVSEDDAKAAVASFMTTFGLSSGFTPDSIQDDEAGGIDQWVPPEGLEVQVEVE